MILLGSQLNIYTEGVRKRESMLSWASSSGSGGGAFSTQVSYVPG